MSGSVISADAHRQRTVNWIDGCTGAACAFDFTTRRFFRSEPGSLSAQLPQVMASFYVFHNLKL